MAFPKGLKHPNNKRVILHCHNCGKPSEFSQARIRKGGGKFCSKRCQYAAMCKPPGTKGTLKSCRWCKEGFYARDRARLFCNIECFHDYQRKFSRRGESHPQWKPRVECVCATCGDIFLKFPSRAHAVKGTKADYCSVACNIINVQSLNKRTSIEIKMAKLLEGNGITFREQVPLYNRWIVDFVVDAWKLIILCDGIYWHSKPKVASKDRGQTNYLVKCGWNVLRLTDKEINEDLEGCTKKIESFQVKPSIIKT